MSSICCLVWLQVCNRVLWYCVLWHWLIWTSNLVAIIFHRGPSRVPCASNRLPPWSKQGQEMSDKTINGWQFGHVLTSYLIQKIISILIIIFINGGALSSILSSSSFDLPSFWLWARRAPTAPRRLYCMSTAYTLTSVLSLSYLKLYIN